MKPQPAAIMLTLAAAGAMGVLVVAYDATDDVSEVHGRLHSPLVEDLAGKALGEEPLRIAVSPVLSPTTDLSIYEDLARYLQARLDQPVEVLRRKTYAEIATLLTSKRADAGFVCTGLYVRLNKKRAVSILVTPHVEGRTTYQSYFIVRQNSPLRDWRDLKGHTIAFSDPLSNSGRLYPEYLLKTNGLETKRFFGHVIYTYGHDLSVRSVAAGFLDAAAVDSLVWETMEVSDLSVRGRTRVIHRSPPMGINPVVVRNDLDPKLRDRLRTAFSGMSSDAEGQSILQRMGISGFLGDATVDYSLTEQMLKEVGLP